MFKEASIECDKVVVALHGDPSVERPNKAKPILSLEERVETLRAIKYIDQVVTYDLESELEKLIEDINPDVRLLGEDYRDRTDYTGYGLCAQVHFFNRDHGWSTTKFKNLLKNT